MLYVSFMLLAGASKDLFQFCAARYLANGDAVLGVEGIHSRWQDIILKKELDEYAKQQAEAKKKLEALTGKSSGATAVDVSKEFKGMSMNKKEDVTSEWAAFETGSKKGRTKNRKEKQTLTAGFKIKDEGYEPRERRDRGGRGGARGGRGGRGGARGGGRGGMNARLDSASDFPTLG